MARTKICNMCGKNISRNDHTNFSINYTYGYDSKYDCNQLEVDLCDECLDKLTQFLIDNCKISPMIDCMFDCMF